MATGTFAIGFGSYVMAGLVPSVSAELDVSVSQVGTLVSVYGFTYAVSTPLLTLVVGRVPRRLLMAVALGLFALATGATAFATTYDQVAVLRGLSAVAAGGFTPTATVLAARLAPPGRRGRAVATVFGGLTTATVLGAPAGNLLGPALGYRGVYALVGGLALVALVSVLALVRVPRTVTAAPSAAGSPSASPAPAAAAEFGPSSRVRTSEGPNSAGRTELAVAAPVVVPDESPRARSTGTPATTAAPAGAGPALPGLVAVVLLVSMLETASALMVQTYSSPLLTDLGGLTGALLSAVLLAYGVAGVAGNVVGGRLADRFGAARSIVLALGTSVLALLLLTPATATAWTALAVFALWGFAAWAMNSPLQNVLLTLAGRHGQLVVALNSSIISLGTGLGALVGGWVVAGPGYAVLGAAAAAVMLVAVVLVAVLSRRPAVAAV
ncbi:MFS transporter [Cellulomonas sp. PS-H5]|uniref:MFS transporter n=1 Tax=Cellulomonas sp. PS-H5 TaxID=2820400 RepID=UPI001C4E61EE|nr:MFS transporter [Cellulomonas sp. PS-H5]MBW0254897.1 MFS transporter [Cellulomonas sp. PS-H5]